MFHGFHTGPQESVPKPQVLHVKFTRLSFKSGFMAVLYSIIDKVTL